MKANHITENTLLKEMNYRKQTNLKLINRLKFFRYILYRRTYL